MSNYIELTKDYVEAIRNNEICIEYSRQKDMVRTQYPDLKKQIDEFRKRNYALQNRTDPEKLFDEIDQFEKEYEEFRKNPIVSDFLAAELAFCRLYQEIIGMLGEAFAKDFE